MLCKMFEMIAVLVKNKSHDEHISTLLLTISNVMHYNNLSVAILSIQCYGVFTMITYVNVHNPSHDVNIFTMLLIVKALIRKIIRK